MRRTKGKKNQLADTLANAGHSVPSMLCVSHAIRFLVALLGAKGLWGPEGSGVAF